MSVEKHIRDIISSSLEARGYRVVRIQLQGSKRKTLQIMIERDDGNNITIDDCTAVSQIASVLLDVNDLIHESYVLEVSWIGSSACP